MAKINVTRLVGGKDTGKLRVAVVVTLDSFDERKLGKLFKCDEAAVEKNLKQPFRDRSVGPVAQEVADAMVFAAYNGVGNDPHM